MSEEIKPKILLVEDDPNLGQMLHEYLNAKSYEAELATDGQIGLDKFKKNSYDFLILDVMMPKLDGFSLASEIRQLNTEVPILFLTAKSMKEDTLKGFQVGADDYMKKPFSMEELVARVSAIMRRTSSRVEAQNVTEYQLGNFTFYANKQILEKNGEKTKLTTKESELLRLLCQKGEGNLLDRNEALLKVWNDDSYFAGRSMDVYISKLRKHFKEDPMIEILTVHGTGFKYIINKD